MSAPATVLLDVIDLSGVFCVADSDVHQDATLWNSVGMHARSMWLSNRQDQDCDLPPQLQQPIFLTKPTTWLHFPSRNSSFSCFPFLLGPISQFLAPAGKPGIMIHSIFLNLVLLRKHDSDLNNFE